MAQATGNAKNILVGASPLFLSVEDSTVSGYIDNMEPGNALDGTLARNTKVPAFSSSASYVNTLNSVNTIRSAPCC